MASRVVIGGGGFAAIEAAAGVLALAGDRAEVTLVAPSEQFEQRPMSVIAAFGDSTPRSLTSIARRVPFALRLGALERVDADRHVARLRDGEELRYDTLVVAIGAIPHPAFRGAITFASAADAPKLVAALDAPGQIAFVVPMASTWSLPIYELALLSAFRYREADIAVVTAEPFPLWIFGAEASEAIRQVFLRRGIALLSGERVLAAGDGVLELEGAQPVPADRAIALPRLTGPAIPGLPCDEEGFIPVDSHGAVAGVADVYAAGDVTAFPLKQGGLAAQQADAVAESIAAALGAHVNPTPFEPVLRGLLLTGGAPLYLRSDGSHGTAHRLAHASVSHRELWWPPAKVAGRHVASLLGTVQSEEAAFEPFTDLGGEPVEPEEGAGLALMLAREDADRGDFQAALRALDTAQQLADRPLAPEWQRTRILWQARTGWSS